MKKLLGLFTACILFVGCGGKDSTFVVNDSTQLKAALEMANDGDTIILESNDYGDLDIKDGDFDKEVKIVSEEEHGASFESIHVEDSSNIKFEDIQVDPSEKEDGEDAVEIVNSENISMENAKYQEDGEEIVTGKDEDIEWHGSDDDSENRHRDEGTGDEADHDEESTHEGADDEAGHDEGAGSESGSDNYPEHNDGQW